MWLFSSSSMLFYSPFLITSIMGTTLALSSTNWFMIWAGLEINMYTFLPLLLHLEMTKRKESTAKYFLAQATGSTLLLMAMLTSYMSQMMSGMLFLMAILLKGGFAPCHYWYPSVMTTASWPVCILLSTVQKITPALLLINMNPQNKNILIFLGTLMIFIGGMGGINQTQLRTIMAYSSIAQMGWITLASQLSTSLSLLMFLNYILIITMIMTIMTFNELNTGTEPSTMWGGLSVTKFMIMSQLINLGGVPPFAGFMLKAMIISMLMTQKFILLTFLAVISSIMSLYFYMKMFFLILFLTPGKAISKHQKMPTCFKSLILSMTSIMIFPIILIMWPWLMI